MNNDSRHSPAFQPEKMEGAGGKQNTAEHAALCRTAGEWRITSTNDGDGAVTATEQEGVSAPVVHQVQCDNCGTVFAVDDSGHGRNGFANHREDGEFVGWACFQCVPEAEEFFGADWP